MDEAHQRRERFKARCEETDNLARDSPKGNFNKNLKGI